MDSLVGRVDEFLVDPHQPVDEMGDALTRNAFDPDELDRFFGFVCERQSIWHRRVIEGESPPWTDDPVLRRYRFTNVYRELDPGTRYAIDEILDRDVPGTDRLFNVMVYRLIGRESTHRALGFLRPETFDRERFESVLEDRRRSGHAVFTGAYTVSGYAWRGSSNKIENVASLFEEIAADFPSTSRRVFEAASAKDAYEAIRSHPGFGRFLAYQVLVDLLYPLETTGGESLLSFSPDEWAKAGPGAQRGIGLLAAGRTEDELAVMTWLWENQRDEFRRRSLSFPYRRTDAGEREPSLADVQNCLCEFSKYRAIQRGECRGRRRFRPDERRSTEELRRSLEG